MTYENLTICIPAYEEEEAIADTLIGLRELFPEAEIIVVDDGSTDKTAAAARAVEGVIVLSHGRNVGYGGALKTAMRSSTRPVIAWCDSDGQHQPEDLVKVVQPVLAGEKDAVIGVRSSGSDVRRDRLVGKGILKMVATMVARDRIPDLNSGLRCFRGDVIFRYLHLLPEGFSASSTTTLLLMKRGYRLGYEEITTQQRTGTSSVRMLRDGWRTIHLLVRILILFDAFAFFAFLSAVQIIAALIYGGFTAFTVGLGFPVLAAVVLISGILTFFMGLICDQITAMRLERLEVPKSDGK